MEEQLLMGAPNWRCALLKICGTAQPTTVGLATILRVLGCGPEGKESCVWISAREEPIVYLNQRPFVLREQSNPLENIRIYSGINGERLEQVEERMKAGHDQRSTPIQWVSCWCIANFQVDTAFVIHRMIIL